MLREKKPWWMYLLAWSFMLFVIIPVFYMLAAYEWILEQLRGEA